MVKIKKNDGAFWSFYQVEYFLEVARVRDFTRATERLPIAQPEYYFGKISFPGFSSFQSPDVQDE